MDGAADAAARSELLVGGIDDRIHLEAGDVGDERAQRRDTWLSYLIR
jgi:hypothetical protein